MAGVLNLLLSIMQATLLRFAAVTRLQIECPNAPAQQLFYLEILVKQRL